MNGGYIILLIMIPSNKKKSGQKIFHGKHHYSNLRIYDDMDIMIPSNKKK